MQWSDNLFVVTCICFRNIECETNVKKCLLKSRKYMASARFTGDFALRTRSFCYGLNGLLYHYWLYCFWGKNHHWRLGNDKIYKCRPICLKISNLFIHYIIWKKLIPILPCQSRRNLYCKERPLVSMRINNYTLHQTSPGGVRYPV